MTELVNDTPFEAEISEITGYWEQTAVIAVKGTFCMEPQPALVDEQVPIRKVDEYYGDQGSTSIRYPNEIGLQKAGTDIVMIGHAYSRQDRYKASVEVYLQVGPCWKIVRVEGHRVWERLLGLPAQSGFTRFKKMPLRYERAYGGTVAKRSKPDRVKRYRANPVGTGMTMLFGGDKPRIGMAVPNLFDPGLFRNRLAPAGFGAIGMDWKARSRFKGTYDKKWKEERAPLLPKDLQPAYWNVAHPDLIAPRFLRGGEEVIIENADPTGYIRFELPQVDFDLEIPLGENTLRPGLPIDLVMLEPDKNRFSLVWKGFVTHAEGAADIKQATLSVRQASPALPEVQNE